MHRTELFPADLQNLTLDQLLDFAAREKRREQFLALLHEVGLRLAKRNNGTRTLNTVGATPDAGSDNFDLFSGPPDRHAVWIEGVTGLERARTRLQELAALAPG